VNHLALLADPTRRRIVELLARGEQSAGEIGEQFALSQPAVSRHLRELRQGGLVKVRPLAQRRIYSLDIGALDELDRWLAETRSAWERRLDRLSDEIERGKREEDR